MFPVTLYWTWRKWPHQHFEKLTTSLYDPKIIYPHSEHWLDSNFIPMDSKKLGFRNFDYIIRFATKNEPEIEKFRSRDQQILRENRFYEIKTLTHNYVNTISDKRNWTSSSDSTCNLVLLTEVWWRRDYVIWRNYEKSIFCTWTILA